MTWIISVAIAVGIFMIIGLMLANDNFFFICGIIYVIAILAFAVHTIFFN